MPARSSPGFRLDETNAAAVARICHRLDGLPLALELAAARTDALAADALAERLDDRFRLLRAGSRAAPTRQQTLEAALDWSYELLADVERVLLRRLAVFSGGFTLEAAEEVCAEGGLERAEVADVLARLVEQSLVTTDERHGARLPAARDDPRLMPELGSPRRMSSQPSPCGTPSGWKGSSSATTLACLLLDPERGNLRTALYTLLARRSGGCARSLCARVALLDPAHRALRGAALARRGSRARARALAGQGARAARSGRGRVSGGLWRQAAGPRSRGRGSRARRAGSASHQLQWRAIHFCGGIEIAREDGRAAAVHYEAALSVARDHRLAVPEAVSVATLGVAAWVAGEVAVGRRALRGERRPVRRLVAAGREGSRAHERRADPRCRPRARPARGSPSRTRSCRSPRARPRSRPAMSSSTGGTWAALKPTPRVHARPR